MTHKVPIRPDLIRSIPDQFSWLDHRLVRDRHIERLSHQASALYLFLVTVADCQGLSYYSAPSLCERLVMDAPTLETARMDLLRAGLVAYKKPLYQVLSLGDAIGPKRTEMPGEPMAIGDIFKKIAGGAR
ncbi:MAG TPA: hypothetical protein DDY22_22075 [Geobacter sp.]|nr:hypothetical protein [Geobacter sp.]